MAYQWERDSPSDLLLLQGTQDDTSSKIYPIIKFNNQSDQIRQILGKHWHLLTGDPAAGRYVDDKPHITFCRNKSIKDTLVSSHFSSGGSTDPCGTLPKDTFKCGKCDYCTCINNSKNVLLPNFIPFSPRHFVNCNTIGILYLLTCSCSSFYIGRTKREL